MAFSFRVLSYPPDLLLSEPFKRKYGTLYSDLKGSRAALFTNQFHTVRLFVLIPLLVLLADFPQAQAWIYVGTSAAGLGWDLLVNPYEGLATRIESWLMGTGKVAGGIGYVMLTLGSSGENFSSGTCVYVLVIFVVTVLGGLVTSMVQQVMETVRQIKEWCDKRNSDKVTSIADVSQSTSVGQLNITRG